PFRVHFHRSEGPQALERYLTGLLTEHPNKHCDTIAQVVPGTSEQRLQGLLTAIDWDEDDLNRQRVQDMLRLPTEGDGVPGPPHQNRRTGTNGESGIWRESGLLRHIFASFHDVCGRFSYRQ